MTLEDLKEMYMAMTPGSSYAIYNHFPYMVRIIETQRNVLQKMPCTCTSMECDVCAAIRLTDELLRNKS